MSWESVRNLDHMKSTLLLIQNIIAETESPEEIVYWVSEVRSSLVVDHLWKRFIL